MGWTREDRVSRLRRLRLRRNLGQDGFDWSQVLTTGITTAGNVAQVALRPPTYSSVTGPYGSSVTSYGSVPGSAGYGVNPLSSSLSSILSDPVIVLGLIGAAVLVIAKR
jgi:hypothetical protein